MDKNHAPLLGSFEGERVSTTTVSDDEHYGCPSDEEAPRSTLNAALSMRAARAEDDAPLLHDDVRCTVGPCRTAAAPDRRPSRRGHLRHRTMLWLKRRVLPHRAA